MTGQAGECPEVKAEKFQRLVLGSLLFAAFVFQYVPLVALVAVIMLVSSFFGVQYTPCYRLYLWAKHGKSKDKAATLCTLDGGASRFACSLGLLFLATSIVLFLLNLKHIAWPLVLVVGTLSVLAGTVGFCLGTAIHALLFRSGKK
jgi:hypothetical protein